MRFDEDDDQAHFGDKATLILSRRKNIRVPCRLLYDVPPSWVAVTTDREFECAMMEDRWPDVLFFVKRRFDLRPHPRRRNGLRQKIGRAGVV